MAGSLLLFLVMLRHHGEEYQILIAVVCQAVRGSFRTVEALACRSGALASLIKGCTRALQYVDYLAVPGVGMDADGGARLKGEQHYLVVFVFEFPDESGSFASLEVFGLSGVMLSKSITIFQKLLS